MRHGICHLALRLDDQANLLETASLSGLVSLWRGHSSTDGERNPDELAALASRLRAAGEPLLAYDVAQEGLQQHANDVRLRQQLALALVDSGAVERAVAVLVQLVAEGHQDEETLGMLGRTHKELWLQACDPEDRARHLSAATAAYQTAFEGTGGYWTGVNAATLAAIQGLPAAFHVAERVHELALADLTLAERSSADTYWQLATLGETCLVQGKWQEAVDWYRRASQVGRGRPGNISSTRRNARLLLTRPTVPDSVRADVEASLQLPPVVIFTGHLLDLPGRLSPRFPAELEPRIAEELRRLVSALGSPICYSSAACGSDLIFIKLAQSVGGEINLVLPYQIDAFERDSVALTADGGWSRRFKEAVKSATSIVIASEHCSTASPLIYQYSNLMMRGLATIRARQLGAELRGLAVWDLKEGDGPGGTAAQVAEWRAAGVPTDIVDLAKLARSEPVSAVVTASLSEPPSAQKDRAGEQKVVTSAQTPPQRHPDDRPRNPNAIKAMLFADALGFSKLEDEQIPAFVEHFMGAVGDLIRRTPHRPVLRNTWGDGLFFVFDRAATAAEFALDLCEAINRSDWARKGLPSDLSLRIGLHAGTVFEHIDPVTQSGNYFGAHVSRAARIEPITPPGQVYASEAFAALLAAQPGSDLSCEYVGQTPLAKRYGTFRTYHVRRQPC